MQAATRIATRHISLAYDRRKGFDSLARMLLRQFPHVPDFFRAPAGIAAFAGLKPSHL